MNQHVIRHGRQVWLGLMLIVLPLLSLLSTAPLRAQSDCAALLKDAEDKYFDGRFDDAVDLATRCLSRENLSDTEKLRGYRIVSLAYIAKGYQEQARDAVRKLLELAPNYEPDPDQELPQFTNLVKMVKQAIQDMQKQQPPPETKPPKEKEESGKKGGGTKWLLIGGGAVAAGVAVLVLGGGGGNGGPPIVTPTTLPTPPPLP
jgi:hypothetical protein